MVSIGQHMNKTLGQLKHHIKTRSISKLLKRTKRKLSTSKLNRLRYRLNRLNWRKVQPLPPSKQTLKPRSTKLSSQSKLLPLNRSSQRPMKPRQPSKKRSKSVQMLKLPSRKQSPMVLSRRGSTSYKLILIKRQLKPRMLPPPLKKRHSRQNQPLLRSSGQSRRPHKHLRK